MHFLENIYCKTEIEGVFARRYNPVLTAKKIRVLVNLLPNNISSSLCFTFIADVMLEMERSGNGEIDSKGMKLLYYNWGKYGITAEHITKIKDIIKYY